MPIFEADPLFIGCLRRMMASRAYRSCETMPEPTFNANADSPA
jgi:hypothetical protein